MQIAEKRQNNYFYCFSFLLQFYDMFTLATHPEYRGKGIGKNLVLESLKLAKEAGCTAAIVLATNDFSRKIFDRIGMSMIATKEWKDCIHNGKQDFGNVPSAMASSHYLKLWFDYLLYALSVVELKTHGCNA